MFRSRITGGWGVGAIATALVLAGCGSARHDVSIPPAPSEPRLVIAAVVDPNAVNFVAAQVRLANLDGSVTASVKGQYVGIVGKTVIVLEGDSLKALDRDGSVRQLGKVPGQSGWAEGT